MISLTRYATLARPWQVLFAVASTLPGLPVKAQDFALSISPPRFELEGQPGETVRAVVELSNVSESSTLLNFATAEWDLTSEGGVTLSEPLKPNSCRPWVAIERRQTTLQAQAQLRYRFEVTPPIDSAPQECRFAIVVSGADSTVSPGENVSFPINAQIAIIVYVAVGEVHPQLRIVHAEVVEINGVLTPVLMVENTGTAHGRLSAFLTGTDAAGREREFAPATLPILPGETRRIQLNIDNGEDAVEAASQTGTAKPDDSLIAYPLAVTGTINDSVNSFSFDGVFAP